MSRPVVNQEDHHQVSFSFWNDLKPWLDLIIYQKRVCLTEGKKNITANA